MKRIKGKLLLILLVERYYSSQQTSAGGSLMEPFAERVADVADAEEGNGKISNIRAAFRPTIS